jgi:hypothetical protein
MVTEEKKTEGNDQGYQKLSHQNSTAFARIALLEYTQEDRCLSQWIHN